MSEERNSKESPIKLVCRVVAADETQDELVRTFRALIGPVRGTPGCRNCRLLEDLQRPGQLVFSEEWTNQRDFARHVRSDQFRRVLVALELAAEPPELEIETISGRRGMGLIFELRGTAKKPDSSQTKES